MKIYICIWIIIWILFFILLYLVNDTHKDMKRCITEIAEQLQIDTIEISK